MKRDESRISYTTYTKATDTELPNLTRNVIQGMTGNPNFPEPPHRVEKLTDFLNDYIKYIKPSGMRTTENKNLKKAAKDTLLNALVADGRYVEMLAGDDVAKLQSSGYVGVSRSSASVVPNPGSIKRFRTTSDSGTLEIICETEDYVTLYEARVSLPMTNVPLVASSGSAKIVCRNLPVGDALEIEVQKYNTVGIGAFGPVYRTRLPKDGEMFPEPSRR